MKRERPAEEGGQYSSGSNIVQWSYSANCSLVNSPLSVTGNPVRGTENACTRFSVWDDVRLDSAPERATVPHFEPLIAIVDQRATPPICNAGDTTAEQGRGYPH